MFSCLALACVAALQGTGEEGKKGKGRGEGGPADKPRFFASTPTVSLMYSVTYQCHV